VILIDANILIYAHNSTSAQHAPAKRWLEATLSRESDVRIGLAGLLAFVRISTAATIFDEPMSPAEALSIVEGWLARENVSVCQPTDRHWLVLADLAAKGQARGSLLMDAHQAALAVEHGATLATTDRDFTRFPGLRLVDPLATS
jgi:uncharacterized protein